MQAISKYGMENMNFAHIVTAFSKEDAKELEKVLIKHYNSYSNGYNLTIGGDSITITSKLSEKDIDDIRDLLENSKLSLEKIAVRYKIDSVTVYNIQNGITWSEVGNFREIKREHCYAKGSNVLNSKLTEDDVYEIKRLYMQEGKRSVELSKIFNVTRNSICAIINEHTWKHVTYQGFKKGKSRGNNKLTESQVIELWELKRNGHTNRDICNMKNLKYHTVYAIFNGFNWKDLYEKYKI